jgi:PKD repeat protein
MNRAWGMRRSNEFSQRRWGSGSRFSRAVDHIAVAVVLALVASLLAVVASAEPASAVPVTVPSELFFTQDTSRATPTDPNRCIVQQYVRFEPHPDDPLDQTNYYTLEILDNLTGSLYTDFGIPGFDMFELPGSPGTYGFHLGGGSSGSGCAGMIAEAPARWGDPVVTVDLVIAATFEAAPFGPGEFQFSPTVQGGSAPFTYQWDYGNGQTDQGVVGSVVYTAPGTYRVRLRVTDAAGSVATATESVVVEAPALNVTVDYALIGEALELDQPTDIVVKVAAGVGVGALSGLNFVGDVLAGIPAGPAEIVAGPTPAPTANFELQPEQAVSFKVTVVPRRTGSITLRSTVAGADAAGFPVTDSGEMIELLSPLEVIVSAPPDDVALGVSYDHDVFPVTVQVRNTSDNVTITNVHAVGNPPIVIGPIEGDLAHQNSVFAVDEPDPDGDGPLTGFDVTQDSFDFGDLAPGAISPQRTYYLKAVYPGRSPLDVLVRGADGLSSVTGLGVGSVNVIEDVLVEFGVHGPGAPRRAGQAVQLSGIVRNLSETKWIQVVAYPDTDLNAGNGFLKHANSDTSATPMSPTVWTLAPGKDRPPLQLSGILVTAPAGLESQAKVDYTVFALSSDTAEGPYTAIASTQIRVLNDDTYSDPLLVPLGPGDPEFDDRLDLCGTADDLFWLAWCGFNVGGANMVYGIGDLFTGAMDHLGQKSGAYLRLVALTQRMWAHGAHAVLNDPEARKQLEQSVLGVLSDMFPLYSATTTAAQLPGMATAVVDEILGWMTARVGNIVEGDLASLTFSLGQVVGENADIVFEGGAKLALVAARRAALTRVSRGFVTGPEGDAAMRAALEKEAVSQETSLPGRVREAEAAGATGEDLRKATRPGDDLEAIPNLLQKAWGVTDKAIDALKKLCDQEGILVALRGRGERAIELIALGLAWAKPEWLKLKNLSGLDLRIFGPGTRTLQRDVVVLAKPPFELDVTLPVDKLEEASREAATKWVNETSGLYSTAAERQAAIDRASHRALEWTEWSKTFGLDQGTPLQRAVNIAPNYTTQGLPAPVATDERWFRLHPDGANATANGWTVYEVQMSGPLSRGVLDPSTFRHVTGDVDILAILHLDGSQIDPVIDAAKRLRIYRALEGILDIQHGESMSFFDLEKRAEYLIEHGKELAVVDPLSVRRGRVIETSTIATDTSNRAFTGAPAAVRDSNGVLRPTFFVLVDGIRPVLHSNKNWFLAVKLPSALQGMRDVVAILLKISGLRVVLTPLGQLGDRVDGVAPAQVTDQHSRNAPVLQPDGSGGLLRFQPGAGSTVAGGVAANAVATSLVAAAVVEPPHGWEPISVAEAMAFGDPAVLDSAPVSALRTDAPAGATVLDILDPSELDLSAQTAWFQPGDRIVIDPGGPQEEYGFVNALGSIILTSPLQHDHTLGELVALAPEPPPPGGLAITVQRAIVRPSVGRRLGVVELLGTFAPKPGATVECGETVTVGIGTWTEALPGPKFRMVHRRCVFVGHKSSGFTGVVTLDLRRGTWSVFGVARPLDVGPVNGSVTVRLAIGSDGGETTAALRHRPRQP